MANVLGKLFQDIADAIRSKTGTTDTLKPNEFPAAIEGITTGGGSSADVHYVTFTNASTGETYVKPVAHGDDCVDPVVKGLWETPTQESTAAEDYTFSGGWSATPGGAADANILKNITEDKTVYAVFTATVREYTITYLDDDGVTVLHTEQLAYGTVPSYEPKKEGFIFSGWVETLVAVVGDATYTAKWDVDNGIELYNNVVKASTNDSSLGAYGGIYTPLVGDSPIFAVGDNIVVTIDGTEYEFVAYRTSITSSAGTLKMTAVGNVKVLKRYQGGNITQYSNSQYTSCNFVIAAAYTSPSKLSMYFTSAGPYTVTVRKM